MKRRTFVLALAALPGLALAAGPSGRPPKNRLVFQVTEDDSRKWFAILGNIRNIQADLGKGNSAIAVVAIGPGLGMLNIESLAANEVQDALKAGVEFVACENSMNAQHLGRDDLIDGIGYAKAGYVELMRRQQQGWAYLRP